MNVDTGNRIERESGRGFGDKEFLDQELEYLWEDRDVTGKPYEVYLGKISRSPVIRSKLSGRYFALPWSKIIRLAVEWGIDE